MANARSKIPETLLQLHIELGDIRPAIWRVVLVPESVTLTQLHNVIQAAMGWWNYHLHEFSIKGVRYGVPEPDWDYEDDVVHESRKKLLRVLDGARRFEYIYDFGDGWRHKVTVQKTIQNIHGLRGAICIAGENACPPEDVGGIHGYFHYLEAIKNPNHPDHESMLDWRGEEFDPFAFDIQLVNEGLAKVRC